MNLELLNRVRELSAPLFATSALQRQHATPSSTKSASVAAFPQQSARRRRAQLTVIATQPSKESGSGNIAGLSDDPGLLRGGGSSIAAKRAAGAQPPSASPPPLVRAAASPASPGSSRCVTPRAGRALRSYSDTEADVSERSAILALAARYGGAMLAFQTPNLAKELHLCFRLLVLPPDAADLAPRNLFNGAGAEERGAVDAGAEERLLRSSADARFFAASVLDYVRSIVCELYSREVLELLDAQVCSFMYRYISRESCSQFDSLPLTSLSSMRSCAWTLLPRRPRRASSRALPRCCQSAPRRRRSHRRLAAALAAAFAALVAGSPAESAPATCVKRRHRVSLERAPTQKPTLRTFRLSPRPPPPTKAA